MEKGLRKEGALEGELELQGLELRVVLGAMPQERLSSRLVQVDLITSQPPEDSPQRLDYSAIVSELAPLQGLEYPYLEDLALRIGERLLDRWPHRRWTVVVRKVRPPVDLPLRQAVYRLSAGPVE